MAAFDKILVVDLEATCWSGPTPAGQTSDIIEIGVVALDLASLEAAQKRSLLVRPARSTVSAFCTELTTLTQRDVEAGTSLDEACRILRKEYDGPNRIWASYGEYDRDMLQRCCADLGVGYPFGHLHLNVKTLTGVALGRPIPFGMAGALEALGLPLVGTHHRGADDAWNIAQILAHILGGARRGIATR